MVVGLLEGAFARQIVRVVLVGRVARPVAAGRDRLRHEEGLGGGGSGRMSRTQRVLVPFPREILPTSSARIRRGGYLPVAGALHTLSFRWVLEVTEKAVHGGR